jgi:uncharacterized repeat protein (TIGR02543 family)
MKDKKIFLAIMAVALVSGMTACFLDDVVYDMTEDVPVTGVSLNKTTASLVVGKTETLTATITPSTATNKKVTWKSDKEDVATVSGGVVTGKKIGTATITVTTVDGNKTGTCTVTVTNTAVSVTGVTLEPDKLNLVVGDTATLTATVAPTDATNKSVTWSSSNTIVATVANGLVTAKAAGSANITVTTADGGKEATCNVTVSNKGAVTGVNLNKTTASLDVGKTETLIAIVTPSTATNRRVTWESSDKTVATVSGGGLVTGIKTGTATITVTTADGNKTATCTVIVPVHVTNVSMNKPSASLDVGKTETLTATVAPPNATYQEVIWTSNKESVATVSGGVVTGLSAGTAIITVTTEDGGKTAICTVTVTATYVVTFDSNGGSNVPNQTVKSGESAKEPTPNPTKDGYTFNGYWYSDSELTTVYDFKTKVTENKTLYAKWIPKIAMVPISNGKFNMGSPITETAGSTNERPQHEVTLSSFWMGIYEVTQEQYEAVMGTNPSNFDGKKGKEPASWETQKKRPVEQVSWYDAIVFCNKLSMAEGLDPAYSKSNEKDPAKWGNVPTSSGPAWDVVIVANSNGYRLPTEAQWEYACRAGTTTAYNTGGTANTNTGWYSDNSWTGTNKVKITHEVGLKPENVWGLFDMHGNVFEWCWDWYNETYYTNVLPPQNNPTGPNSGTKRVTRGGSYDNAATSMRSASRSSTEPYNTSSEVGFRVVRP